MKTHLVAYWASTALLVFSVLTGGAAASWAMLGDSKGHLIPTLFLAALTLVSWALRPLSRIPGVLFPVKTRA
jgi:hypothetical protein